MTGNNDGQTMNGDTVNSNTTKDGTTDGETNAHEEQPTNARLAATHPAHLEIEHGESNPARPFWKVSPLHRRDYGVLAVSYLVLTSIYLAVGWMIVNWWESSALGEAEADVSRWFEDQRTDDLTHLAELGSALSNTETKIALGLVMLPLMLWMFRRWHEWAFIVGGLVLEVAVFGTTAKIIARDRPPVEQLDGAPTNSWPSGHIAAAVVFYVGLAIVIWCNPRFNRGSRIGAVCIAIFAPATVITSRLYLGMHYLSDALGGVVLGLTVLAIMWRLLFKSDESEDLAVRSEA